MAIGESGKPVKTTVSGRMPEPFAARVAAHIHKGSPEATVGGPGPTIAEDANLAGSDGSTVYGDE